MANINGNTCAIINIVIIDIMIAKPLSLVKSFKWLATEKEYESATNFVNSLPEPLEGSTATNIADMIQEIEAEKKTLKYKLKHIFDDKE